MRDEVTIAKGCGIIMMVMAHCSTPYVTSYIYMFHMPLFFILSGYCFKEKYLNDKLAFIWRRIKGLYVPFVKWGLLFLLLHNLFFYVNIYNSQYGWNNSVSQLYSIRDLLSRMVYGTLLFNSSEQLLGGYWFLIQLFFASIISLILIRYLKNAFLGCGLAIVLCIAMKLLNFRIPYTSICDLTLFSTSFYIIGYLVRKHNMTFRNVYVGLLSAITIYIGSLFWYSEMPNCPISKIIPYFFTAVLGSLMVLQFSKWLNNFRALAFLRSVLIHVGNHTLEILTWHFLSFKIVTLIALFVEDKPIEMLAQFPTLQEPLHSFWWILYTIAGVIVPLTGIWLKNRVVTSLQIVGQK